MKEDPKLLFKHVKIDKVEFNGFEEKSNNLKKEAKLLEILSNWEYLEKNVNLIDLDFNSKQVLHYKLGQLIPNYDKFRKIKELEGSKSVFDIKSKVLRTCTKSGDTLSMNLNINPQKSKITDNSDVNYPIIKRSTDKILFKKHIHNIKGDNNTDDLQLKTPKKSLISLEKLKKFQFFNRVNKQKKQFDNEKINKDNSDSVKIQVKHSEDIISLKKSISSDKVKPRTTCSQLSLNKNIIEKKIDDIFNVFANKKLVENNVKSVNKFDHMKKSKSQPSLKNGLPSKINLCDNKSFLQILERDLYHKSYRLFRDIFDNKKLVTDLTLQVKNLYNLKPLDPNPFIYLENLRQKNYHKHSRNSIKHDTPIQKLYSSSSSPNKKNSKENKVSSRYLTQTNSFGGHNNKSNDKISSSQLVFKDFFNSCQKFYRKSEIIFKNKEVKVKKERKNFKQIHEKYLSKFLKDNAQMQLMKDDKKSFKDKGKFFYFFDNQKGLFQENLKYFKKDQK